jgi:hypothetical protein
MILKTFFDLKTHVLFLIDLDLSKLISKNQLAQNDILPVFQYFLKIHTSLIY